MSRHRYQFTEPGRSGCLVPHARPTMSERSRAILERAASWYGITIKDCVCGPTPELVRNDDGTDAGWLHIHHSLDGRELAET